MSKFNNYNKKVKITYNNIDNNIDIDSIFREMEKILVNFDMNQQEFNSYADKMFGGNYNIEVHFNDENEKKEPNNLSFKKWKKWFNK